MIAHPDSAQHTTSLLSFAIVLTALAFGVEIAGYYWSGSVALLSDVGHLFADLGALIISLAAVSWSLRPPTDSFPFGFHRLEVLAALLNGLLVCGVAVGILVKSISHFSSGVSPLVRPMLLSGALGLVVNVVVATRLYRAGRTDINLRSSYLHVASDALASLGVLIGGVLIAWTGWAWVDPLVGVMIALVILVNAFRLLRDTARTLMETCPPDFPWDSLRNAILKIPGVTAAPDLRVWQLCSHVLVCAGRVTASGRNEEDVRREIETLLKNQFEIQRCFLTVGKD